MADEKICPLTYTTEKGAYDQEVSDFTFCVKEKCAWWVDNPNLGFACCSIMLIALQLDSLAYYKKAEVDNG